MKQKLFGVTLEKLLNSLGQTVYMVGIALFLGSLLGLAIALVLVLCRRGGQIGRASCRERVSSPV